MFVLAVHSYHVIAYLDYQETEARSRMRALDWARDGIKTAQLNKSSRSLNILFYLFINFFFNF